MPGFAHAFLVDGKPPEAGATLKQTAFAATLEQLAHAGLDDFYRGDVGARDRRPISTSSAARSRAPISRATGRRSPSRCGSSSSTATLFNTPPPTQGLASLIILALFERLARARGGKLRSRARHRRSDQARVPRARPRRHRSGAHAGNRSIASSMPPFSTPKRKRSTAGKRRPGRRPRARATPIWMGAADASGLVVSYIQSLYWEFGSGVRAAGDRRR